MTLHFAPLLPCDRKLPSGRLCGQPTGVGIVRCDGDGWRLTPICLSCVRELSMALAPPRRAVETKGATP